MDSSASKHVDSSESKHLGIGSRGSSWSISWTDLLAYAVIPEGLVLASVDPWLKSSSLVRTARS